ncbi:unnamed protein product [Ilex paraguariensis]|uniref:Ionotropic glutamate receptor C-terminal domain-containing protein n=1 Tax=Ilex paraguariensis TaxID=185542 RepID=A0ABC8RTL1_9AQUA
MRGDSMDTLAGLVSWSRDLKVDPRGWPMHSNATPLKIGVPGKTTFPKFVKVDWNSNLNKWSVSGFCIDVFYEVLNSLEPSYPLPHEFVPYNGSYNDLVDHVANKTFDAVIGDVTILANRSKYVQFTQPYAESSLSMIVTVTPEHGKAWIFLMPFTMEMWAVTAALLLYTVFIIWLLERQSNPEFAGPWYNQLATSLWFTFTSLFFAHRERVQNSYTRVVVVVWLFVVLVLSSSYTASFSSMLTVQRLKPNITDIEWLQKNNATVGCDDDSFIKQYLQNVLQFNPQNIKGISSENDYITEFENGNIIAAFLELPESKAFMNQFCKGYTVVTPTNGITHRFGGFGFVFPKGSPIADVVSQAILTLSENGRLEQLEAHRFSLSPECLNSQKLDKIDSLSWQSFWGLYLCSAVTSTICYVLFATRQSYTGHITLIYSTMLYKLVGLVEYLHIIVRKLQGTTPNTVHALGVYECNSSTAEYTSSSETPKQSQAST